MKKITRINGVDCKIGRNSRTGSTISMIVPDENIIDVVSYFNDFKGGNDPTGKIKKIELVIYEDAEELETIESLREKNQHLRDIIDNIQQPILDAIESSEAITEDVEEDLSTNGQANICVKCDRKPEGENCHLQCSVITENPEDRNLFEEKENLPPNQQDLKLYEKPCECETPAVINGKCANCGGVE